MTTGILVWSMSRIYVGTGLTGIYTGNVSQMVMQNALLSKYEEWVQH